MTDKLSLLLEKIRQLEHELLDEIKKNETEFSYEVRDKNAHFTAAVAEQHKKLAKTVASYVRESSVFYVLTAPTIWLVLVPVVLLHGTASIFQWFCFPVYGIPKVRRSDYVVLDRRLLKYLNPLERMNIVYCEYVNGVLGYVQEIAGSHRAVLVPRQTCDRAESQAQPLCPLSRLRRRRTVPPADRAGTSRLCGHPEGRVVIAPASAVLRHLWDSGTTDFVDWDALRGGWCRN